MSHYTTQLFGIENERIRLFVKVLNTNLQVLSLDMTSVGNTYNEVVDYVTMVEGIKQVSYAKVLSKKSRFR